jgi:hypothetical protein
MACGSERLSNGPTSTADKEQSRNLNPRIRSVLFTLYHIPAFKELNTAFSYITKKEVFQVLDSGKTCKA